MLKSEQTQRRILDAARRAFAERGFDGTSLRTIASAAGVDPALCLHYFGSKAELFVAATELPIAPGPLLASAAGDPEHVGRRVADAFLGMLDDENARSSLLGLVRSAAADADAADMVRQLIGERVVGPAVDNLAVDEPELRATLVGSQLIGLLFARHIVAVDPLACADAATLSAAVAPTIQRYLTGELR